MPRLYVSRRGHVGVGFGCLGGLFVLFAYMLYAMLIALVVGSVLAFFLLSFIVAYAGVGIDALLRRFSGSYAAKRVNRGPLRWPAEVVTGMSSTLASGKSRARRR